MLNTEPKLNQLPLEAELLVNEIFKRYVVPLETRPIQNRLKTPHSIRL